MRGKMYGDLKKNIIMGTPDEEFKEECGERILSYPSDVIYRKAANHSL
jgi:hypothetical protein